MRDSTRHSSSAEYLYNNHWLICTDNNTCKFSCKNITVYQMVTRRSTALRAISSLANKHELRMVKCIFLLLAVPFLGSTIFILYYLYVSFHYLSETMASSNDRTCTSFYIHYFFYVKKNYVT